MTYIKQDIKKPKRNQLLNSPKMIHNITNLSRTFFWSLMCSLAKLATSGYKSSRSVLSTISPAKKSTIMIANMTMTMCYEYDSCKSSLIGDNRYARWTKTVWGICFGSGFWVVRTDLYGRYGELVCWVLAGRSWDQGWNSGRRKEEPTISVSAERTPSSHARSGDVQREPTKREMIVSPN